MRAPTLFGLLLPLLADAGPIVVKPAMAQPHRIGVFFWHDSPNDAATFDGVRDGLAAAGVAADFVVERAGSDPERAAASFAALRAARCELVFALGTQAALLAKQQLADVPVVFAAVSDAVAAGVVPDWSGSGAGSNLCGASNWIAPANVLEVFQLAVPGLHRLGMLRSQPSGVVSAAELARMREHLARPGAPAITLHEAVAVDAADIGRAVGDLLAAGVDAIWIPIDLTIYQDLGPVRQALGAARVPLLSTATAGVHNGALAGTAVDYVLHGRRAAALALRVLRGEARPGDVPVDRMQSSLVLVNLGAARAAGVELPLSLLVLADELIDREQSDGGR